MGKVKEFYIALNKNPHRFILGPDGIAGMVVMLLDQGMLWKVYALNMS